MTDDYAWLDKYPLAKCRIYARIRLDGLTHCANRAQAHLESAAIDGDVDPTKHARYASWDEAEAAYATLERNEASYEVLAAYLDRRAAYEEASA